MTLSKLEIHNFKSYKGTHVVGPFDRFSCIVGPNGSGKSNILDAISFVLNVPNIYLRAKHLKNLIEYSSNEAYVRIYIGDKMFERRVSKSNGENESIVLDASINQDFTQSTSCKYSIDGSKVTQKQYNAELEQMNILCRIRNFVIYQGDIIKTDVDLLKMIENVCGSDSYIEEYKELNDKILTLNKDLNSKYEKRKDCLEMMKEMKGVKEKEKTFESLVVQKDEIQKRIYELEIKQKKSEISRIKDALRTLEQMKEDERYNESLSTVNRLRSEAAKLQKEYFEKETELTFIKSRQNAKETVDVESKISELKSNQETLRRLKDELSKMASPMIFNNETISKERFEMLLSEKEREYLQKTAELEKSLSELTLKNFDKINRRDYLQNSIKQMNSKMHRIQSRNFEIEKENSSKQEKMRQLEKEIQMLENQIKDKASTYDKIISDEEKLNKELNDVMREILINKAKKSDVTRKSLVKNVVENLKTIFSGVHGRLIDLIEPIQKKYELSIGVLLSKYDQSVVVDNEKTAMDCLRYIKDSRSCKLTFLPLNRIQPYLYDNHNTENSGNKIETDDLIEFKENLAKKCIKYSDEYEDIISFVFKNSLVVDTVDRAKHILYSRKYPGKICTLDGVLFTPGGLISGGKTVSNKFEDDIIDHLLSKRKTILNDIKMNKDRKEAYSDITAVKLKIEDLKDKRNLIKLEPVDEIDLSEFDVEGLKAELKDLEEHLKEFEQRQRSIKESKKQIEKNIFSGILGAVGVNSLQEYKEKIKEEYRRQELTIKIDSMKDRITVINEEIAGSVGVQEDLGNKKDLNQMENEVNRLYNNLETVKEKLKSQNQVLKNYSEKRNQLNNSILNHQLHLTKTEEDLKDIIKYAELESNYKDEPDISSLSLKGESSKAEDGFKHFSLDALKVKLEEINKLISQNVTTVSSVDSSIQSKFARLNSEYELVKEELLNLKRRFQEVKNLRMDAFSRCFTVISSEITEIYRGLTMADSDTDSNAYLVYEGDPFSNNVKYYLMPPSKRFVPFQDLSGGERSIALLSFVFALSRFRRPPFYIFDEVDSALDKINVERFGKYILDSEDQFLVISLKPQFFSKSQSLFGVYKCPFNYTSKVLSYKLE